MTPFGRWTSLIAVGLAWMLLVQGPAAAQEQDPDPEAGPDDAPAIMSVDEIRPGMTGYGLSVFEGQEPVRFDVEVIAVLPDALPDQDMILIRCSGQELERSRIVAGMSGSPIYLDDRLIGALAYGWSFSRDPIAGVAPVENMLEAMSRERTDDRLGALPPPHRPGQAEDGLPAPFRPDGASPGALQPVETPLVCSGMTSRGFARLEEELGPMGFVPVQGGGATGREEGASSADPLVPGDAVGVQLVRGDLAMTAVGTVTHVEGDRLVAFGHPFIRGGFLQAPLTTARVHEVFHGIQSSFKFASPVAEVGALSGDFQAAIVGEMDREASMIPIEVSFTDHRDDEERTYGVEVVDNPFLTPLLVNLVATNFASAAAPATEHLDVNVRLAGRYNGDRTFEFRDRYPTTSAPVTFSTLRPLQVLFRNGVAPFELESLTIEIEAEAARPVAEVRGAFLGQRQVRAGEEVDLHVLIQPFDAPARVVRVPLEIPAEVRPGPLLISLGAGPQFAPDLPAPRTLDDVIRGLSQRYRPSDLVVSVVTSSFSVKVGGRNLEGLPGSVVDVLQPLNGSGAVARADLVRFVESTDHLLVGTQQIVVPVVE